MPVVIDKRRSRHNWAGARNRRAANLDRPSSANALHIALVNNMPDPALEDTESQFASLLTAAAGDCVVYLKLYSIPSIVRKGRAIDRLMKSYFGPDDLWNSRTDGIIVTGTEPLHSDLREEAYWHSMVEIFDWAERNTAAAALSCLAAHASVLHSDGIERQPLASKRFGVFEEKRMSEHCLMQGIGKTMQSPHSRWNEVTGADLTAAGYTPLTKSADAGVNLFLKERGNCVFLHFQGHPEYARRTLLKEYRRDVTRFLRGEREDYPSLPQGYFDPQSVKLLADFKAKALSQKDKHIMWQFPEEDIAERLQDPWRASAVCVYRNWLNYIGSRKVEHAAFVPASAQLL